MPSPARPTWRLSRYQGGTAAIGVGRSEEAGSPALLIGLLMVHPLVVLEVSLFALSRVALKATFYFFITPGNLYSV